MIWPYPGKVLIIDDKYDNDIKEAVKQLLQNSVPVQYWNGKGKAKRFPNTRVVLLDLILRPEDEGRTGPEKFDRAIEVLDRVRSASIVIILSNTTDLPSEFEARLSTRLNGGYPGVIASTKIGKGELVDHQVLISRIQEAVNGHPEVRLALLLESVIDWAKDGAFQATLGRNVQMVKALIKIIDKQSGGAGPRRELVDTMVRVLSRYAHSGKAYKELRGVLEDMLRHGPPNLVNAGAALLSFLMYYRPNGEHVWTGDIFRRRSHDGKDIGVVLTPPCDLAWEKPKHVSVVLGFALADRVCSDRSSILFLTDPTLRNLAAQEREAQTPGAREQFGKQIESHIKKQYRDDGKQLPESSYFLRHVDIGESLTDIYLNLKDIKRVPLSSLERKTGDWRRISRVDSPFVERLLQRFGEGASRIGVPDFNLSMENLRKRVAS